VSIDRIRARFAETPFAEALRQRAAALPVRRAIRLKNTVGSTPAFAVAEAYAARGGLLLAVLAEPDSATYLQSDLEQLLGEDLEVLLFPPTGHTPYDPDQVPEHNALIRRADVLQRLQEGFAGVVVASVDALSERVAPPETVRSETLTLAAGDTLPPEDLMARLVAQGFEAVEFVSLPGEVALRGGIVDVYPFAGDYPVRIEFFGDEVDSLREFDPQTQRSVSRLTAARLVPNLDGAAAEEAARIPLLDYFPEGTLTALFDDARLPEAAEARFETAAKAYDEASEAARTHPPEALYVSGEALAEGLARFPRLLFGTFASEGDESLTLEARPQPPFNSDVRRLRQHFAELKAEGVEAHLLCDSPSQRARLRELLADEDEEPDAALSVESLHEGFVLPEARLAVYTDHQVFNRYHRPTARRRRRVRGGLSLRDVQGLSPGDFVVHVDHGIGRFAGLHKITVREKQQEAVKLEFFGGDELFVSVGALHKLHKYTGKEGHQPKLTKLGSGQWERAKSRTKKRVKDLARDLISLYAKRKASRGHSFAPDSTWQREMEASFKWEDTPDQAAAATAVKEDMELPTPMDRLVCGDVGFGKTEIAVRAAFKAVQDGKQAAVLVPTTLLAMQHYETFSERLARYPVKVEQLSRLMSASEIKDVLDRVASGTWTS
jgi:transcription-repair coupling factor (superfamily II helicase)